MNMMRYFLVCLAALALLSCNQKQRPEQFSHEQKNEKGNPLFPIQLNGKCGYIDRTGKIIIESQFDECLNFSEGLARVNMGGDYGKWGYIDTTGKYVIPLQFDYADDFSEGLAGVGFRITFEDTSGYFEKPRGKTAKIQFAVLHSGDDPHTGPKQVTLTFPCNSRWGYIDKTGKVVVEPQYCYVGPFREGLAGVTLAREHLSWGKSGFIDKTGKMVIGPQFHGASYFSEGLAAVTIGAYEDQFGFIKGGKDGYIDKTGKVVINPQFDEAYPFSEGLACVRVGNTEQQYGKYGFIDKTGKMVIRAQFGLPSGFSEGLANVMIDDNFGFIDKTGRIVIKPRKAFYNAFSFSEGLAWVTLADKKSGYIDKKGKIVIKLQSEQGWPFENGLASVSIGDKSGYIDKTGKYVWKPTK